MIKLYKPKTRTALPKLNHTYDSRIKTHRSDMQVRKACYSERMVPLQENRTVLLEFPIGRSKAGRSNFQVAIGDLPHKQSQSNRNRIGEWRHAAINGISIRMRMLNYNRLRQGGLTERIPKSLRAVPDATKLISPFSPGDNKAFASRKKELQMIDNFNEGKFGRWSSVFNSEEQALEDKSNQEMLEASISSSREAARLIR